ncbi:MAG: adenylosuccinate synthase [Methanosarcinales archaeon]|nr:adenylosuccinate synthase [Methanosarcinales archaeon]
MFTIITGTQFGDEGKGKIVDLMTREYDLIVRFQGGDNAGHTVVVKGKTFKLHVTPSGVLFNARLLIGPGVVLNPQTLAKELDTLADDKISVDGKKLGIDAKTSIIMPYHVEMDGLRESARTEKIGTTKRGIGYAYIDKVARDEIQFADLIDEEKLRGRLNELAPIKAAQIESMGGDPAIMYDENWISTYIELGRRFAPFIADVSHEVNTALDHGKKVLAEGAQGTHLDVIHGTQKFVTSSSCIAGSACANLGVGPTRVDQVLGILKAYITRVGEGPLPTELKDDTGEMIQKAGGEFGTTTGRPRRCGWFDLPLVKKSVALNGYTNIALTKLDVLSNIHPLRICAAYQLDGKTLDYPPEATSDLARCKPVFEDLDGWDGDLTGIRKIDDLPAGAIEYVNRLESLVGVPFKYISVGPGREQTFIK